MADKPDVTVLIDSEGTAYDFPEDAVPGALSKGFRRQTDDEIKDRALNTWASDNPTLAALASAGRDLTFGATDAIIAGNSSEGKQKLIALEKQNPVADIVGSVGMLAVPFAGEGAWASRAAKILTESKSVVGAAKLLDATARVASAPMNAVGSVGKIAGSKVANKVLSNATRFATEAELYNIGHNVSEQALGDEDYTAENLLAHSGQALIVGAGLGVAGSAASAIGSKAVEQATKLRNFLSEQLPKTMDRVDVAYGVLAEKVGNVAAKDAEKFVQKPMTAEGMATRERMTQPMSVEETEKVGSAIMEDMMQLKKGVDTAAKEVSYDQIVPKQIETYVSSRPLEPIVKQAQDDVAKLIAKVDKMRKTDGEFTPHTAAFENAVTRVKEKLTTEDPGKIFSEMVALRKEVTSLQKKAFASFGASKSPALESVARELSEARTIVSMHLRNPSTYGDAASGFARIDAAFTDYSNFWNDKSPLMKMFGTNKEFNSKKFASFVRNIGTFEGTTANQTLQEAIAKAENIAKIISEEADKVGVAFDKDALNGLGKRIQGTVEGRASRVAEDRLRAKMATDASSGQDKALRYAAGAMIGGIPGAVAVHAYNVLRDPVATGKALLGIEKLVLNSEGRVKDSITSMLGAATRAGKSAAKFAKEAGKTTMAATERVAAPVSVGAMRAFVKANDDGNKEYKPIKGERSTSTRLRDFRAISALLESIATDPGRAYDRYEAAFKPFATAAPQMTQTMVDKQLEAAMYLHAKMPKNPSQGQTLNQAIDDWHPSDQDIAVFERYVKAAQDPLSVLDDMKAGTLTREGVETIKTLYPRLYGSIQTQTIEHLATLQVKLPYYQRINLSVLLGLPVDQSMTPSFVTQMQGYYAGSVQQTAQGSMGGKAKGGGSIIRPGAFKKNSEFHMTATQRITNK